MVNWLSKEKKLYEEKHRQSKKLWSKATKQFPAGVSHNIRDFHMTPLNLWPPFIQKGSDVHLTDLDGNQYLDFWLTHGSAILGHANREIKDNITNQLSFGTHHGMVNNHALDLADRIIEATPCIQKLRFCTTGTEATMYASRLARAFTKKNKIVKVRGGWHGGNDTLFYYVKNVEYGTESQGLKNQTEASILSFDYNDTEGFVKLIQQYKNEIAAVIIEPVLGAGGAIPPREGFLETIREVTTENDILLIFDEIITGFRLSYHSAQGYFGIMPDLVTMGKIIGGGLPIGVVGGRSDILELANLQKGGDVWIGGGTFSGNPISMVSGKSTLDILRKYAEKKKYEELNKFGQKIRTEVSELIEKYEAPAIVTGVGSMLCIHWFNKRPTALSSSTEVKLNLAPQKVNIFQLLLLNRNILIRSGFGYLSFLHTQKDINQTLKAMEDSIKLITHNS